jgi:hypothetical protein
MRLVQSKCGARFKSMVMKVDMIAQLGKEEREKQNLMEIKAKVLHRVLVLVIKTP